MKNLSQYLVPGLLALIALLLVPERARSIYSSPVQVVNPSSAPVPASNNDGRNIVRLLSEGTMPDGTSFVGQTAMVDASTNVPYTVPAGKRLVVDAVNYQFTPPIGQVIYPQLFNGITFTLLPVAPQGNFVFVTLLAPAAAIRDYVDQNHQLEFSISRSSGSGSVFWYVAATGRLVDCTNGGDC